LANRYAARLEGFENYFVLACPIQLPLQHTRSGTEPSPLRWPLCWLLDGRDNWRGSLFNPSDTPTKIEFSLRAIHERLRVNFDTVGRTTQLYAVPYSRSPSCRTGA
jgi:hypothetical protein